MTRRVEGQRRGPALHGGAIDALHVAEKGNAPSAIRKSARETVGVRDLLAELRGQDGKRGETRRTNVIVPLGPTRTLTLFEWYFREPDAPSVRERISETIAFSDEIQREDIDICEAVQRGLRSTTYDNGRYSPSRENGVHHFHGMYAQAMGLR